MLIYACGWGLGIEQPANPLPACFHILKENPYNSKSRKIKSYFRKLEENQAKTTNSLWKIFNQFLIDLVGFHKKCQTSGLVPRNAWYFPFCAKFPKLRHFSNFSPNQRHLKHLFQNDNFDLKYVATVLTSLELRLRHFQYCLCQ